VNFTVSIDLFCFGSIDKWYWTKWTD